MDLDTALKLLEQTALPVGLRLLAAVAIWIIGRMVIRGLVNLVRRVMSHDKLDATLTRYFTSILTGVLTVFLALGVIDFLGIPTTSFAALAAGAGLAIGAAWSGMLANFAAGVFMIVMRPFKVGDHIEAAGITGVVKEIGLFATWIDTQEENVQTLVGNNKLFADKIFNFSGNPVRTLKLPFQVAFGYDYAASITTLEEELQKVQGVNAGSAKVEVNEFTRWGPVLEASVDCAQKNFLEVKSAAAAAISRVYGDMGFRSSSARRTAVRKGEAKPE